MSGTAHWWNKNAQKYYDSPISNEDVYQRKLEITREYLSADSEVLEFGCGTGGTAIAHAPYVRSVLATDISDEMLEFGRQQAAEAGVENVRFEQADFDTLEAKAESFDAVLGLSILHLLKDRRKAMSKVRDVLKPGGVFVSSTACLGDRMWFMAPILCIGRLFGAFPFVRIFTVRQLVRSVEDAGFVVEHEWLPKKAIAVFVVARKPA